MYKPKLEVNRLLERVAQVFSYLFLPPVILLSCVCFSLFSFPVLPANILQVIWASFLFGFLFPIIAFLFLRMKYQLADHDNTEREERNLPYRIGIFILLGGLLCHFMIQTPLFIKFLWVNFLLVSVTISIINAFWKISAHLMSLTAGLGGLVLLGQLPAGVFLVSALLLGWARIYLKIHSLAQVVAGFIVGSAVVIINYFYITRYFTGFLLSAH